MSEYRKLSRDELDELAGQPLPERAAMSLINSGIAAPGASLLSDDIADPAISGPVPPINPEE